MLTLFDNTMTPIMTLPKRVMVEAIETHEINVAKTLEVTVQAKKEILAALENARYAATSIKDSNSRYTIYRLAPYNVEGPLLYITGLEKFYDDMEYMDYIQDYRPTNKTPLEVFTKLLEGSNFTINYIHPQIENRTISTNFYYISRLESLSKAVGMFGIEIEAFSAIDSKGNVTGNYVNITNKLGKTLNTRYSYGRNTSNVVAEYDPLNVVTSVLGRGKGEENDEGNYGRRIMFTDVVWSKATGDPLDKPAGENILTDPSSMALNAFGNGKPRLQIVTFEDCETPEELIQLSYEWLIENNRPKVQFKATPVVFDENTAVGDTVTVVRSDLDIIYQTRIFKFTRNLLSPNASIVEFGDKLDKSLSDIQKDFSSELSKQWQSDINATVGGIVVSGSGSNISYGESEPISKKPGDMWYETYTENGIMKYRLKIWNGTAWEVTISEEMFIALQGQIDTAMDGIDTATQQANAAVAKADTLETQVGGFDSRITDVEGNFSSVVSRVDGLQTTVTDLESDTTSKISQLSDDINLRVIKGDVINQINLSTEGILIAGEKVHITGQTVIDNAVIKDAMIGSMSATKLTAGTIDASKINVINIDAANITANKTQFVESAWNSVTSSAKISANGLELYRYSGNKLVHFDADSMRFYDEKGALVASIDPETIVLSDTLESLYPAALSFDLNKKEGAIRFNNSSGRTTMLYYDGTQSAFAYNGWTVRKTNFIFENTEVYLGTLGVVSTGFGADIPVMDNDDRYWNTNEGYLKVRNSTYQGVALEHGKKKFMAETFGVILTTGAVGFKGKGTYNFVMETTSAGKNIITSDAILNRTYSTVGSNNQLVITSNGIIGAVTSSKRFKLEIEESNSEQFKKILNIKPKTWFDKRESEEKADYLTRLANGEDMTGAINPVVKRTTGAIAEDFVDAGLDEFVIKDDDTGEVNGLAYERAWLYLIPLVKELYERIDVLEKSNM